jgi:hypothetical protein
MTPILAFLQGYLGRRTSLVVLCLLYAGIIMSCVMVMGYLSPTPIRYLDMR